MKNIFKMMGVALLACSMIMVSCKKDDENTSEGGGQGGQTGLSGLTIKWDGADQTLGFKDAYQSSNNDQLFVVEAAKALSGENVEYPYFVTCFWNSAEYGLLVAGEFTFTYQEQQVPGQNLFPTEVYTNGGYSSGSNVYGEYQWAWCNNENYSSFDATTLKANINVNMTFYELMQYASAVQAMGEPTSWEEYQALIAESDPKEMVLVLDNYAFEAASATK